MTKIRQFISFGMAVIMMCSTVNPHPVYADVLPSESEIEQSENEQPTEIESVTEAESELESETASETDTEPENDGIYNDAEYINDLMINDIAVYSNSRPTGDGREPSGGSLRDSGGHRVGRTGGGHTVSSSATASSSTEKFLKDIRDDIDNLADLVDGIGLKLVAINNNLCDAIGYLWDISMAVERVSSSVSTCANWLAKSKDVLDSIHSDILQSNVLIASINVAVGNLNKSLTSYLTSFNFLKDNVLKDYGGKYIGDRINDIYYQLENLKSTAGSELKLLSDSFTNFNSALLYNGGGLSFMYIFETVINSINAHLAVIRLSVDDVESKLDEIISAVKNFSPSIVINNFIDNSDRTKSDDEDENASLFDLIKMIMYSVFILGSLLDLLLLLLEYVVLMFQIPAVPALMNENVLLGWNYANAICIPGTQFSIISFLRLLMYITVIFSAIKVIKKAIDNGSIGVI